MKNVKFILPGLILAGGLMLPRAFGKMEYVKQGGPAEGQKCTVCHVQGKKDLNDVGKCWKDKKDLAACQTK